MLIAASAPQYSGLNAGGWTVLVFCITLVCGLVAFCYYRLLREPKPSQHHHAPLDIDTHDVES